MSGIKTSNPRMKSGGSAGSDRSYMTYMTYWTYWTYWSATVERDCCPAFPALGVGRFV